MREIQKPRRAARELARLFRRNGYVRRQDPKRLKHGWREYKKGDEIRLVAESKQELAAIRRLLSETGFKPGRPFRKGLQVRVPIYGRNEVARFLSLVGTSRS